VFLGFTVPVILNFAFGFEGVEFLSPTTGFGIPLAPIGDALISGLEIPFLTEGGLTVVCLVF